MNNSTELQQSVSYEFLQGGNSMHPPTMTWLCDYTGVGKVQVSVEVRADTERA